ncbi:hypothetical protein BQ8794_220231 [Mesorhizobium prunaredense]|uniref:Uncharacterized protein n=1 Tax=Mesorhizobium prunaredense TaxID=1631249 RepID=A0A1R3VA49_9HYPH|nr:hypothetical protein BQ8794_220231 [Mesorhizobium prunaredense]
MISVTDPLFCQLPLRMERAACGACGSKRRDAVTEEDRRRVRKRIAAYRLEKFLGEGFQVDPMGVACVGDRMEDSDRTADAEHSVADHDPYGCRPSPHDLVDRHIGIDGFELVHDSRLQRRPSKPSASPGTLRRRKQMAEREGWDELRACRAEVWHLKVADTIPLCVLR